MKIPTHPPLGSKIRKANIFLYVGGGVAVFFTLLSTVVDVIARATPKPITGTLELCQLALVILVCLTWAHTQAERGHISIDLVYVRFSPRAQAICDVIVSVVGLFLAAILVGGGIHFVGMAKAGGLYTDIHHIPIYPFRCLIIIGGVALFCHFALDLVDGLLRIGGHNRGTST